MMFAFLFNQVNKFFEWDFHVSVCLKKSSFCLNARVRNIPEIC